MSTANSNSSNLSSGLRSTRKFRCGTCQRAFTKGEHLARHERSHSNQKPFACPDCSKVFGRQDVLSRHRKMHENSPGSNSSGRQTIPISNGTEAMNAFSPAPTEESVMSGASPLAQPLFQLHGDGNSLPMWSDTEDMLEFLTSDLSSSWPVALPVTHFASSSLDTVPPTTENQGQGHQAMQQMSHLISVLSSNLATEIQSTGITSSFLDTCMHVFFDKFIPSFPVLHRATFNIKESSHPLLLNIMALGSLFVGAKNAIPKGEAMWRLAHIAVATNWKHLMATKGPRDSCEGVQLVLTAVLGQTYALMSKNESLRMTSQTFHGLGFYWARQCGMFDIEKSTCVLPSLDASEATKVEAWKTWAALEIQDRAVLGHYVLDGLISQFSGYEGCARHMTNPLHIPVADSIFEASTVDEWIIQMQRGNRAKWSFRELFIQLFSSSSNGQVLVLSSFTLRVLLEGLQSLVAEAQQAKGQSAVGTPSREDIAGALIRLHNKYLRSSRSDFVDQIELLIRWHSICIELAVPTTPLCRRMCTAHGIIQTLHDTKTSDSGEFDFVEWCQSSDSLRAVLHCMAIQELVERLPLGRSHAIHLPAAIFSVATIYSARCLVGFSTITTPRIFSWEVLWDVGLDHTNSITSDGVVEQYLGGTLSNVGLNSCTKSLMYELNSLHHLAVSSRWGVSHEMDALLNQWMSIVNGQDSTGTV